MSVARPVARTPRPTRPTPTRPWLRVVPPIHPRAPRAPFVVLVGMLLTTGLGALLFLHTTLAEESFYLHDLRAQSLALAERQQALEQEVASAASPQRLAVRARALGMVRSENPVFIRTADGRILGVPKAGVRPAVKAKPRASTAGATAAPSAEASDSKKKKKKPGTQPDATPSPAASTG